MEATLNKIILGGFAVQNLYEIMMQFLRNILQGKTSRSGRNRFTFQITLFCIELIYKLVDYTFAI